MVDSFGDSLSLRQVDLVFGVNKNLGLSTKSFLIGEEDLVFICRKNHPRLETTFSEKDVANEMFCYVHTDELPAVMTRQRIENQLLSDRNFTLRSPSFMSILSHIESSNSVAIVPRWLMQRFKDAFNIKMLETEISLPVIEIAMSYNKMNLNKRMNTQLFTYLSEQFSKK